MSVAKVTDANERFMDRDLSVRPGSGHWSLCAASLRELYVRIYTDRLAHGASDAIARQAAAAAIRQRAKTTKSAGMELYRLRLEERAR